MSIGGPFDGGGPPIRPPLWRTNGAEVFRQSSGTLEGGLCLTTIGPSGSGGGSLRKAG